MRSLPFLVALAAWTFSSLANAAEGEPGEGIAAPRADGLYVAAETKVTPITADAGVFAGGDAAWVHAGRFALGGSAYLLASTHTPTARLDPPGSGAKVAMAYGGGRVAFELLRPTGRFRLWIGSLVGVGHAGATSDLSGGSGSNTIRQVTFFAVEPTAVAECLLSTSVSLALSLSWRWLPPTGVGGLSTADLGGPAAGLGIRYGLF